MEARTEGRTSATREAKNARRFRFYTLYDRVWRRDTLETAWSLVAQEGKAAGVDGVTAEAVLARENGVDEFLTGVQEQLRSKSYRPAPIRRVYHSEMNSKLESPALKLAGEPSTGNLYTRFDEGARRASLRAGSLVYSTG